MTWIRSLKLSRTLAPGSSPPRCGCFSSISLTLPPCLSPLTLWSTCLTSAHYIPFCPASHMLQHFFYITFMAFHHLKARWVNNYSWSPSLSQQNSFVSILLCPGMAGGVSACFEVKEFNHMEAEFCQHLDWCVVISGPELESFSAFSQWFMVSS